MVNMPKIHRQLTTVMGTWDDEIRCFRYIFALLLLLAGSTVLCQRHSRTLGTTNVGVCPFSSKRSVSRFDSTISPTA